VVLKPKNILVLSFFSLSLSLASLAGQPSPAPDVKTIMSNVLARAKETENTKTQSAYTFRQHDTVEDLAEGDRVKERTELDFECFPIDGQPYQRLVAKNGRPLTADEKRKQEKTEREFLEKMKKRRPKVAENEEAITLNEELISRYRFTLDGEENIQGRPAYRIGFQPDPEQRASRKGIMNRIMDNVRGTAWVDQGEYEIVKVEAVLTKELEFGWGILGKLSQMRFGLEQTRLDDGTWMMSRVEGRIHSRAFVMSKRVRWESRMSDFRRAG